VVRDAGSTEGKKKGEDIRGKGGGLDAAEKKMRLSKGGTLRYKPS